MSGAWHTALAWALVGERLELGVRERPDIGVLLAELAERGYDRDRVAAIARDASTWPFPVPDADRAGLGPAQLSAAVRAARQALGLEALEVRPRSGRTALDGDERRLLADVPPHY